ncbi:MAG: elongation factor P [Myxococcota bacterium]|nr:elongation factor P [Myxococcota bacterium]
MYDTSDIRKNLKITIDGNPWVVVEFQFVKPGKGTAFTRTRIKNMITGAVLDRTFKSGEKLQPADVEERRMQFMYREGDSFWFMDSGNYEQIAVDVSHVGDGEGFLAENLVVDVLFFNGKPIGVTLPTFVEVELASCEPGLRGDTASGGTKPAKLSTGAVVQVPLHVNEGDRIKIDTRDGTYVERVRK